MAFLDTCKNDADPSKNEHTRVLTTVYIDFFRRSRAANSVVGDGIWQIFKVYQAFMVVLVICKNKYDPIKNEGTRVLTTLYIDFSDAQGQPLSSL